ncbi:hypothetical protein D3C78_1428500 [compost metagenome]
MPDAHAGPGRALRVPDIAGDHLAAERLGDDDQRQRTGLVEHLIEGVQDHLLGTQIGTGGGLLLVLQSGRVGETVEQELAQLHPVQLVAHAPEDILLVALDDVLVVQRLEHHPAPQRFAHFIPEPPVEVGVVVPRRLAHPVDGQHPQRLGHAASPLRTAQAVAACSG